MYRVLLLVIAALVVGNCAADRHVWSYYDACASQTSSFVAMAECGRQKELAACSKPDPIPLTLHGPFGPVIPQKCSPPAESLAFMQYADALAMQVKRNEMTEAEAFRRFAEYKTQVIGGVRRNQAIAASSNVTCIDIGGGMVTCR